jgi:hypothetical protein
MPGSANRVRRHVYLEVDRWVLATMQIRVYVTARTRIELDATAR